MSKNVICPPNCPTICFLHTISHFHNFIHNQLKSKLYMIQIGSTESIMCRVLYSRDEHTPPLQQNYNN
jgi:hypothetical protein